MAYEQGLFELADPLRWYIPSFKQTKVWRSGSTTAPIPEPITEELRSGTESAPRARSVTPARSHGRARASLHVGLDVAVSVSFDEELTAVLAVGVDAHPHGTGATKV